MFLLYLILSFCTIFFLIILTKRKKLNNNKKKLYNIFNNLRKYYYLREKNKNRSNKKAKRNNKNYIKTKKITSVFAIFNFKLLYYIFFDYIYKRKRFINNKKKLYKNFTI